MTGRRARTFLLAAAAGLVVGGTPAAVVASPAPVAAPAPVPASAPAAAPSPAPAVLPAVAPLAAADPFERSDDGDDGRETATTPAGTPSSSPRLDRLIATLRRSPLAVDPELEWIFDADTRARLVRTLQRSTVPVRVAVLPLLDEDESGGDAERVLQALQRGVGRDAVYVVVEERGRFEVGSVGIRRSLEIPYDLLSAPDDDRPFEQQADDPPPPGWASIADRLGTLVATAERSGPGPPNAIEDDVREVEPLDRTDFRAERNREDAIAASVTGLILGIVLGGTVLGILAGVRAVRDQPGSTGRGSGRGGAARGGGAGAAGRGGAGRRQGRRGRRRRG